MESMNQYYRHFTSETYNCYTEAYTLHEEAKSGGMLKNSLGS
jgi:hypothetical protein